MIFGMVIYVTLINLTEMECILLLKSCLFLCLCVLESLALHKHEIKMIFHADENLKHNNLLQM